MLCKWGVSKLRGIYIPTRDEGKCKTLCRRLVHSFWDIRGTCEAVRVLSILEDKGLKINVEKSLICQKEVNFLGYTVSRGGIKVKRDKCEAILKMPRPHSVTKVPSFLGSLGYNRRFIKDFSVIARPLHQLTKKGVPFEWTEACEESYQALRSALMSSPVLSTIDYTRKLILTTDASQDGLGVTLSQLDPEGKNRHVSAYMSRSLHPHERAYCITQREALCIVTAFKYFTTYLRFCEFEIRTDHRPHMYLLKMAQNSCSIKPE